MKIFDGWQRVGIVLSLSWTISIALYVLYEYRDISAGGIPVKFVQLYDLNTKEDIGDISLSDVKYFGKLALEASNSSSADPADAKNAKFLLEAKPEPILRISRIAAWVMLPVFLFWAIFIGVRWVARGFRND